MPAVAEATAVEVLRVVGAYQEARARTRARGAPGKVERQFGPGRQQVGRGKAGESDEVGAALLGRARPHMLIPQLSRTPPGIAPILQPRCQINLPPGEAGSIEPEAGHDGDVFPYGGRKLLSQTTTNGLSGNQRRSSGSIWRAKSVSFLRRHLRSVW